MMTTKQITSKSKEDDKRKRVIELYLAMKRYGKPNLADIGRQVGYTREWVRKIVQEAGLNK